VSLSVAEGRSTPARRRPAGDQYNDKRLEWEREAIGERTRDAMSHKKYNGKRVGNIEYGSAGSRRTDEHLEPDPHEQGVITAIKRNCCRGAVRCAGSQRSDRTRLAHAPGVAWRLEHVDRIVGGAKSGMETWWLFCMSAIKLASNANLTTTPKINPRRQADSPQPDYGR